MSRLEASGVVLRRPDPTDGRVVLVEITEAGRAIAGEATRLLNSEVFSRSPLTSPGMREMVDTLRHLRREAGDFQT